MSAASDSTHRTARRCLIALTLASCIFFVGYPAVRTVEVMYQNQIDIMSEQNAHDEKLAELHSPCSRVVN